MQASPQSTRWQAVGASTIGTIVEWYDFFLYGTAAALVLNKVYFPNFDPLVGVLLSYSTFAVGYLIRPFGGLLFGHLGDRYGRKPVLIATLLLMGLSTAAIGVLPTYGSIGIAAPIILLLLRMLQGLGAGAEYSGAILFSAEYGAGRRGFFSSWPPAAVDIATALAAAVFFLFALMPSADFLAWGWRLPFLLSLVGVVVGVFMRRRMLETAEFTAVKDQARQIRVPAWELVTKHPRRVLVAMGANVANTNSYIYTVYTLGFMTRQLGVSQTTALTALLVASIAGAVASVLYGRLSDRIGRRSIIIGGALATALYSFPFFWLLETRNPLVIILAMVVGYAVFLRAIFGVQASFYIDLFEVPLRYSGIALARETTSALLGGMLPLAATAAVAAVGGAWWPVPTVMTVLGLVTVVAVALAPPPAEETAQGAAASATAGLLPARGQAR